MHLHFNSVQQCIQISIRINCSKYIHTSVFVSFETSTTRPMQFHKGLLNPIFNSKCPDGGHLVARALWGSCMFDVCGSISDSRCGTLIGECNLKKGEGGETCKQVSTLIRNYPLWFPKLWTNIKLDYCPEMYMFL